MISKPVKTHLLTKKEQKLFEWVDKFTKRFPKWVDERLFKGLYHLLGTGMSPSFINGRSFFHLKRILLTQFLLQKKIESELALKKRN